MLKTNRNLALDPYCQEGERLLVREQPQVWSIELTHFYRMNVVRCEVITNGKRTLIIGAYFTNSTLDHLPDLDEALACFRY